MSVKQASQAPSLFTSLLRGSAKGDRIESHGPATSAMSTAKGDTDHDHLVVGIDVGGTNTDAVALRGATLLSSAKVVTTSNISDGIRQAVTQLAHGSTSTSSTPQARVNLHDVAAVFVGTTSLLNALLEGRGLVRVAVVRLTGPSSRSLPPLADFPASLRDVVCSGTYFASGGLKFDGSDECLIDEDELCDIANEICQGAERADACVVSGTFSPVDDRQERQAAEILRRHLPKSMHIITSSGAGGGLGLLARENSAVLDATLSNVAQRASMSARVALLSAGLSPKCRFFFTANDGSAVPFTRVANSPLRSAACGPANSMRGAAFLSSRSRNDDKADINSSTYKHIDDRPMDRIVLDVGGTSTDAGCLIGGIHPRDANSEAFVAGVRCNHRMTDVVSIALGGGSVVSEDGSVGPESVGADITSKAVCFGGSVLTATCVAVAVGSEMAPTADFHEGAQRPSSGFDFPSFASTAWDTMQKKFYNLVEKARTDDNPVEVVVVGGGAGLVDSGRLSKALGGGCTVVIPDHAAVANACGSAMAHAVGAVEIIADLSFNREETLAKLKQKACDAAGVAGRVIEYDEIPLAYLPGKLTRIRIRASAPLDIFGCDEEEFDGAMTKSYAKELTKDERRLPALRISEPRAFTTSSLHVEDGMWKVSEYDAHCIAIGAGILGCGGGGNTHHGLIQLLSALRQGKNIRVISASVIADDALVAPCGFMGAPTVCLETIGNPENLAAAIRTNPGKASAAAYNRAPEFITVSEIGGSNGLKPLIVGGIMDLPVVDADLMGRAFPELQMTTASIYGLPQTPITAADAFGRCVTLWDRPGLKPADKINWIERVLRPVSIEFGCSAAVADPIMSGSDIRRVGVLGSITRARQIGDCILRAKYASEAIEYLLKQEGGKLIFEGKITEVQRETTEGFAKGRLNICGGDNGSALALEIEFQNEFIIARMTQSSDGNVSIVGCVPDIISILDADTARPIATEECRFGFRVFVVLLPISSLLRSPEGLSVVGPVAFGLQDSYESPLYDDTGRPKAEYI